LVGSFSEEDKKCKKIIYDGSQAIAKAKMATSQVSFY
jgi:hypothetical protein